MKRIVAILALAGSIAACNNSSDGSMTSDTTNGMTVTTDSNTMMGPDNSMMGADTSNMMGTDTMMH